jgi:hypothetical protein
MKKVSPTRRRARRIVIATVVAFCSLVGLYLVRITYSLTADIKIHYPELLFNTLVTLFVIMAVELILEGFSLRAEDLSELESSIHTIGEKLEKVDTDRLTELVIRLVATEWEKDEPLVEARKLYGLERIYSSRNELKSEILENLKSAKERIWLLAITFSQGIQLEDDLLRELRSKLQERVQVRILGANSIRSISVFRTLLETSKDDVRKMVKPDGFKYYFDHRFYLKFREFLSRVNRHFSDHQEIVRFYPHVPGCWLVLVDDKALYYQPYVLGRIEHPATENKQNEEEALTIGDLMPVFKFVDSTKKPFRSLVNHFEKLWATSDVDMFHMGARVENKDFRLRRIFKERGPWFEHVVEALWVPEERRRYPRKLYRKDPSDKLNPGEGNEYASEDWMFWEFGFSGGPVKALGPIRVKMEDVSYDGCAVRIDANDKTRTLFQKFSATALEFQKNPRFTTHDLEIQSYRAECVPEVQEGFVTLTPPPETQKLPELEYLVTTMRERSGFEFKIQNWNWDKGNPHKDLIVGLQYRRSVRKRSPLPCVPQQGA